MLTMKAMLLGDSGPELVKVPMPTPLSGEVVVRVRAAGLNRADLLIIAGQYHGGSSGAGAPLGLEFAGEIAAVGDGVGGWNVGDRVMASGKGCFAQYVAAPAVTLWRVPDDMELTDAAGLPVALLTAHDAVVTHGRLARGQDILVLGASSGVGLMALQMARFLGARGIIGTSTTAARRARLDELGATQALDTNSEDWAAQVLAATDGEGVDVVIDCLSGETLNQTMTATKIGGRIVNVGRLAGRCSPFDFDLHALRRLTYVGVTFRTRSTEEVRTLIAAARQDLAPALANSGLRLPVDEVLPVEEFAQAFARMEANRHFGKILLQM